MSDDAYWMPQGAPGQDTDRLDRVNRQDQGLYQIDRQTIVPVRYVGGAQAVGFQVMMGIDTRTFTDWNVTLTIHDRLAGGAARFTLADPEISFQPNHRGFVGSLPIDTLMAKSKARVNQNLLQLTANFEARRSNGSIIKGDGQTKEPLHIILQKLVIVLPEMMGSSLWINNRQRWPSSTLNNLVELKVNNRGQVVNQVSKIAFNQSENHMRPRDWERWLHADLPTLRYKRGRKTVTVPYYRLQGYPYDWRLSVDAVIDQLLDVEGVLDAVQQKESLRAEPEFVGKGRIPATSPSIRTLLRHLKQGHPFLAEKVALVGHGAGGLIVNGAIRRAGVEEIVDRAFCVATPFLGASTAYQAFLSRRFSLGEADAFTLTPSAFSALGSNLPMLYHFAPSPQFPYPVAKITGADGAEQRLELQHVGANGFIEEIQRLARQHQLDALSEAAALWNPALAVAADQYFRDCETNPIRLGENRYLSIYASAGPASTVGQVRFNGRSGFFGSVEQRHSAFKTAGDGVATVESLRGALPQEALYQLEQPASHLDTIDNEELWTAISNRLVDWAAVAMPPPAPGLWIDEAPLTWVAFSLVDEDDEPVANERFQVTFADGSVREGKLDAQGQARIEGIAASGACTILFPNIDANDWRQVTAVS